MRATEMIYDGTNSKEIEEWSGGYARMKDFAYGRNGDTMQLFPAPVMVVCSGPSGDNVADIGDIIVMPTKENHEKYRCGVRWVVRKKDFK